MIKKAGAANGVCLFIWQYNVAAGIAGKRACLNSELGQVMVYVLIEHIIPPGFVHDAE